MNDTAKNIILNALEYCLAHKKIKPEEISTKLKDVEINNIVMKDCAGFAQKGGSDEMMRSKWKLSTFGLYTIIILKQK